MREVVLPEGVTGRLWLTALPSPRWPVEVVCRRWQAAGVERVLCLVPWEELDAGSPAYAAAAREARLGCTWIHFPVDDFGVPEEEAVLGLARDTAAALRRGEGVLVHCHAGIGRTGMVATCILLALGLDPDEALRRVRAAGSDPEAVDQLELIHEVARMGARGRGRQ
ncbi:MAG: phosphatase [Nitrospirae bacterium]|nr:MAG: phosphatase [Nitrospirota bacterium]